MANGISNSYSKAFVSIREKQSYLIFTILVNLIVINHNFFLSHSYIEKTPNKM